jgi:hypothetical protein
MSERLPHFTTFLSKQTAEHGQDRLAMSENVGEEKVPTEKANCICREVIELFNSLHHIRLYSP